MKTALIIVGAIVLVLVGAGIGYKMMHKTATPTSTNTTASTTTQSNSTDSSSTQTPASTDTTAEAATITYSNDGFSPASITVKSGTTVTIKNTSSHSVQFDSDPHPAHTDDKDLNAGLVTAGKTMTFVAVNKGTFGYHNHLNASETGTIIVQ